jgi:phage tail sheath protein FI
VATPAEAEVYFAEGAIFRFILPSRDVSEQLNTPSVIFAGKLIARVGLATNKPAEFVILRISQDTRALQVELAATEG